MLAAVLLDGLEPQACGVLQGLGYLTPQLAGVPSSQVRVEHVTTIQAIINQTSETETGKDLSMVHGDQLHPCIHGSVGAGPAPTATGTSLEDRQVAALGVNVQHI